jgi:hypothetical protein
MADEHLTDHWPVAPGHELSQEDWDEVVRQADEWAGRTMTALASPQIPSYVDIPYPGAGGRKDNGPRSRTQLWVIHTAECPLKTGYARSLSLWSAGSTVQSSWHRMSDPGTVARYVPKDLKAWHATVANPISRGYEQAGYAAFTRATWLTDDGQASIDRLAQVIVADGIPADAVRWLTDDEVRRVLAGDRTLLGLCDHAQVQPKDRTDPGKGYPRDLLLERIRYHHPDIPQEDDMATPQEIWTGTALVKNVTAKDPDTAPRVAPSFLLELAATNSITTVAQLAALSSALQTLASTRSVDPDAILAAVKESADAGVAAALKDVRITLSNEAGA